MVFSKLSPRYFFQTMTVPAWSKLVPSELPEGRPLTWFKSCRPDSENEQPFSHYGEELFAELLIYRDEVIGSLIRGNVPMSDVRWRDGLKE